MAERVRRIHDCVCLSPFLDTLAIFLAINNTLSDSNAKKRVENPMRTKVLLVKRLSKMRSKITYVYVKHLKRTKTHRFEFAMFYLGFRVSCHRKLLDTTYFLKQNTIYHNPVKVSDPNYQLFPSFCVLHDHPKILDTSCRWIYTGDTELSR